MNTRHTTFIGAAVLASMLWASVARADAGKLNAQHRGEAWQDTWYLPDHTRLQFAGFTGLVAVSVGFSLADDHLEVDVMYGFTPAKFGGRNIHSAALKNQLRPVTLRVAPRWIWTPATLGVTLIHDLARDDTRFFRDPARYPDNYYPSGLTTTEIAYTLGTELEQATAEGLVRKHGGYVEISTLQTQFSDWRHNREAVAFADVLSAGAGYRASW